MDTWGRALTHLFAKQACLDRQRQLESDSIRQRLCEYGETGRHTGFKLPRFGMTVRFRLLAPTPAPVIGM